MLEIAFTGFGSLSLASSVYVVGLFSMLLMLVAQARTLR